MGYLSTIIIWVKSPLLCLVVLSNKLQCIGQSPPHPYLGPADRGLRYKYWWFGDGRGSVESRRRKWKYREWRSLRKDPTRLGST